MNQPASQDSASLPSSEEKKKPSGLRLPKWLDKALLLVGIALLVYVVSRFPAAEIVSAVRGMWPGVALTPFIAIAWFCCSTTALYILIERRIGWLRILWIRLVGDSYNALLPMAGFGGEPFKVRQLSLTVEPATVMTTLIVDRIIDNAMGFLYCAFEVLIGLLFYSVTPTVYAGLVIFGVATSVLGVLGLGLVLTRLPGRLGRSIAKVFTDVPVDQIRPLPVSRLIQVILCCITARLLGTLEKIVLLWCLGLPHGFATAALIDSFLNAAGYLSFMIPQGLGVFEGATVYILGVIGAPGPAGIAFAFGRRGRMIVVGLFGISLHFVALIKNALVARAE